MTQEGNDREGMKEQTEIDMLETREILTIMLLSRAIRGRSFGDCSGRHCFLVAVEGLRDRAETVVERIGPGSLQTGPGLIFGQVDPEKP